MVDHLRALVVLAIASAACSAPAPSSAEGVPPAFESTSPPPADTGAPDAFEMLKTATVFEGTHLGYAGVLSRNAEAFRALLASPDAKRSFRALYTEGTLVGKLYAVAGLYFVDPEAFEPTARALAKRGGHVRTQDGCIGGSGAVSEILFVTGEGIRIPRGKTIADYFAAHRGGGMGDIAGGFLPLRLAAEDDALAAPREPLPP